MGLLSAMTRQPFTPAQQPGGQPLPAATLGALPPYTQAMAQSGQLQPGAPQPLQQGAPMMQQQMMQGGDPQPMLPHTQPWRSFGGPEGGAMSAAAYPALQQNVLGAVQQFPQLRRSHTLGSGR